MPGVVVRTQGTETVVELQQGPGVDVLAKDGVGEVDVLAEGAPAKDVDRRARIVENGLRVGAQLVDG